MSPRVTGNSILLFMMPQELVKTIALFPSISAELLGPTKVIYTQCTVTQSGMTIFSTVLEDVKILVPFFYRPYLLVVKTAFHQLLI